MTPTTVQARLAAGLRWLPFALVRLASARLPREFRSDLASEWAAELHHVLQGSDAKPLTQLLRGLRYAAGLLMSAPAVADGFTGKSARLARTIRAVAATGAVGFATWLVIISLSYFQPASVLVVLHTWNNPVPPPPPDQLALIGVSLVCGAAAFLGMAALLVTGRWLIANLSTLCFAVAGILSYLGGGPVYSLAVAAVVLAILAVVVQRQARNRRRRRVSTPGRPI